MDIHHFTKCLQASYRLITEQDIEEMAKHSIEIHNILVALKNECFGILAEQEAFSPIYTAFYINGSNGLRGEAIELNIDDKDNIDLLFGFAPELAKEFTHLDIIEVYNNYADQLRSYLERFDYRTVSTR
jgi:hypothetical protein